MSYPKRKAEIALDILDGVADKWAEEVDLTSMIKNAVSPMGLARKAPQDVIASFTLRMEAQISAIVRQAFIEGSYRAIAGLQDEKEAIEAMRATAKPACPICAGTGYNVTHVETTAWREAVAFDRYEPCECTKAGNGESST